MPCCMLGQWWLFSGDTGTQSFHLALLTPSCYTLWRRESLESPCCFWEPGFRSSTYPVPHNPWAKPSHKATPDCKGCWDIWSHGVPRKKKWSRGKQMANPATYVIVLVANCALIILISSLCLEHLHPKRLQDLLPHFIYISSSSERSSKCKATQSRKSPSPC